MNNGGSSGGGGSGGSTVSVYRSSILGCAFKEAVEEVFHQSSEDLSKELRESILSEFDKAVSQKFAELQTSGIATLSVNSQKAKCYGKCSNYNNVDETWKFSMYECDIKTDQFLEKSTNLMILATDKNLREGTIKAKSLEAIKPKPVNRNSGQGGRGGSRRGGSSHRGGSSMRR